MLGLDVQEQSQLPSLESSLSNTVNHKWPILHVHFIDEPISNWDIKEQGDPLTKNLTNPLPEREKINITEFMQVPETTCFRSEDCPGHLSLNSAVMLGTVEKIASVEISSPDQMDLQESVGSSAVQDRGDILEIGIYPKISDDQQVKDDKIPNESSTNEAEYMDVVSTDASICIEKNANSNLLQPEPDAKELSSSNLSCLMETELQNSIEQPPDGQEECTVLLSSENTSLSNILRDRGSSMCLEAQKVPLSSCTSHNLTKADACDIQEGSVLCEDAFVCKDSKCSDLKVTSSVSFLFTKSEGNVIKNDTTRLKQSCLEHCMPNMTMEEKAETSAEDIHSQDIPNDHFSSNVGINYDLSEVVTIQPNLKMTVDNPMSAKTPECSFLPNSREHKVHPQDVSLGSPVDLDCANKLGYKLVQSSCSIHLLQPKAIHEESVCRDIDVVAQDNEISIVEFRTFETAEEQKMKEQSIPVVEHCVAEKLLITKRDPLTHDAMTQDLHCTISQDHCSAPITELPAASCTTQVMEHQSKEPDIGCDISMSCKIVTAPASANSAVNGQTNKHQTESNIICEFADSENSDKMAENDILSIYSESSDNLAISKTILSLNILELHGQAATPECKSASDLICSLESTPQNSLVPYMDIWSFLTKPTVHNMFVLTRSAAIKAKTPVLKLRNNLNSHRKGFLYAKACIIPHRFLGWEDINRKALSMRSAGQLTSIKALLLKWPEHKFNIPKRSLRSALRVKKSDQGLQSMCPTVSQSKRLSCALEDVSINIPASSLGGDLKSANKSNCNTVVNDSCFKKMDTSAHPFLSRHQTLTADILPSSVTHSEIKYTQKMKDFPPKTRMVTRSKNKINSKYLHTVRPVHLSTSTEDPNTKMQSIVVDHRPPFQLCKSQCGKESSPEIPIGPLKRKRMCSKTVRMLPKNNNLKQLSQTHAHLLPKDCIQHAACEMEMEGIQAGNALEKAVLKLDPRNLTCTVQAAKRPKTSHENVTATCISDLQGCKLPGSHKPLSLPSDSMKSSCKTYKVPDRNHSMVNDVPLRRQPRRKCKSIFMQEFHVQNANMQSCDISTAFNSHNRNLYSHRLLPSKRAVSQMTSNTLNADMMKRDRVSFNKCTAEQTLLQKLSSIASRLTAPGKNSPRLTPLSTTTKLVPVRSVKLQARKLLNVFSCVNMKICSRSAGNGVISSSRAHLPSPSMDLCAKVCPDILGSRFSLPTLDNATFPVSFHLKVDSGFLSDFMKFNPPDYMFKSVLPVSQSAQLSESTLSFFLSPNFPATSDGVQLFTHWDPNFRCLGTSDSGCRGQSDRRPGCSMLGLHTVLALSSPGCYRLWTRKRNLGSRIPTVQKLSVTHFAHGLKGLTPQSSWGREAFSSLAFSLGRVMSMWSRHGLSAFSDFAAPHPQCSSWQPSKSISISSPSPSLSTDLLPKNCLAANEPTLQFNVSYRQGNYLRPSQWMSAFSDHGSRLFLEEGGLQSFCSLFTKQSTDVGLLNSMPSQQHENIFYVSTKQTRRLESLQYVSSGQSNNLGHMHCLSIEQLEPQNVLSSEQADIYPSFEPKASSGLFVQQEDAHKPPHCLLLKHVSGCKPQLPSEQSNGFTPSCKLSTDQVSGFGRLPSVPIGGGSHLGSLHNIANKHSGIKPLNYLIAKQDIPTFPPSEVSSIEQGISITPPCFLAAQADDLETQHSLFTLKKSEDLSALQDTVDCSCIPKPSKTQACHFEKRKKLPIPHAKAENQNLENQKEEDERKPRRVSQIRIRKTIPKPDTNLTPMGLPKPKRVNKKEFSLEDIYTNKNYKSPPPARSLETIFEEPKEKNGVLVSVSQTKRKRILEFRDCTVPRPKRTKGKIRVVTTCKRGRKAATEGVQLDALLIQKLLDLENFLLEQEALEQGSDAAEKPS